MISMRWVAVVILALAGVASANASSELPVPGEDEALYSCKTRTGTVAVTLKPETELKDLVAWVSSFTCKNFILDPRIVSTGKKVTVIAPNRMTASEAYRVLVIMLTPYIVKDQMDLESIRSRKAREHDEFAESLGTLDAMPYRPATDYRRKRGLVEEINRGIQTVEDDRSARESLTRPTAIPKGVVEY